MEKEMQYKGYTLNPRNEATWPEKDRYGFWVSKDGCNPMPGACWFRDEEQAIKGIKALEASNGDSDLFWLLMGNRVGLDVYVGLRDGFVKSVGFPFAVRFAPNTTTIVDHSVKDEKTLSPQDALRLAAILREAAEKALGVEL